MPLNQNPASKIIADATLLNQQLADKVRELHKDVHEQQFTAADDASELVDSLISNCKSNESYLEQLRDLTE
jgi:hypothetical protein